MGKKGKETTENCTRHLRNHRIVRKSIYCEKKMIKVRFFSVIGAYGFSYQFSLYTSIWDNRYNPKIGCLRSRLSLQFEELGLFHI